MTENTSPTLPAAGGRPHERRFLLAYALLAAALLLGCAAGLSVRSTQPARQPTATPEPWSSWQPPAGRTATATLQAIARHVQGEYQLGGKPLTRITAGQPTSSEGQLLQALTISGKGKNGAGTQLIDVRHAAEYDLCAQGRSCAPAAKMNAAGHDWLVRRQALELALLSFRFQPQLTLVLVYQPPRPGSAETLLLFRRADLLEQILVPLADTLAEGPLPARGLKAEPAVQRLTDRREFRYQFLELSDGSTIGVLERTPDARRLA